VGIEGVLADLVDESSDMINDPVLPRRFNVLARHLRCLGDFVDVGKGCC
jgi:hypothetical protein